MAMWKRIAIFHEEIVLSVSPQAGKGNSVFIGIVIVCESHKYSIPLSSPKEKHKNMKYYVL